MTMFPFLTAGLEENKADLVRLLSEKLSWQVADAYIVTAGALQNTPKIVLN